MDKLDKLDKLDMLTWCKWCLKKTGKILDDKSKSLCTICRKGKS